MMYSKTTDGIIRELNDLIAKAKDIASSARKNEISEYASFWSMIADTTDDFADKTKSVLKRITVIAEHPDEITNRFAIIKVIEDIAFQSNLLAFNAGLMVSRGQPEHIKTQWPLCEKYLDLARTATMKSATIAGFFNELSALIFEDMRKASADKISTVITKGKVAVDCISGYENIKSEVNNVVICLSVPIEEVTVSLLEDNLFKLQIISFAADMDVCRNPKDKVLFEGITAFKDSLSEAVEFFRTLVKPESNLVLERTAHKHFQDIAYQGNILLFYSRGEIEKMGGLLNDKQKSAFGEICDKVNDFIQFAQKSDNETAYKPLVDKLYSIHSNMIAQADKLNDRGGAIRFLAGEFKGFADSMMKRAKG
jgi:hypothetical protein